MTKIEINQTTKADLPALKKVMDEIGLFESDMLDDMIAPALSGESDAIWLTATADETLVGFCYTEPEMMAEGAWNMYALGVHPNQQGKGVGKALVQTVEAHLREKKQRLLIIDTSGTDAYDGARKFYNHIGYEEESRIREFWAKGDDKITFRKKL